MAHNAISAQQEAGISPDVLVVGGGPAGSTISTLLAERGYDVVLLEKSHHPRFHIGESLLPMNLPLFERLGLKEQVASIGMLKYGAEFVSPDHDETSLFEFGQALDKSFPYSYEVRRSELDEILFKNARAKGARAYEGCDVKRIEFPEGERPIVVSQSEDGQEREWRPRFLVDATGRETFLANQFGIKRRNRKHASASVYGHFAGAERRTGNQEGNITLFWFEHGWFWYIPLRDGSVSVGVVCWPYYMKSRKTDMERFFFDTIALCPPLAKRLQAAKLVAPVTATGNFSYSAERCSGNKHIMIGDAFAFIDPVFSSGVFLAMNSAFMGAEAVDACLKNPAGAARTLKEFDRDSRYGLKIFSWIIYRMTTPAMRNLFMKPSNKFRLQETLLSVLAGDLYRDTPIRMRLFIFKVVYYLLSIRMLGQSYAAWRRRKHSIRNVAFEATAP
ncbi:MAG: tryptophan 7-halogenase [Nitrosomonadales bacterium]|nr:tryptophan 7-halogenase [Nitrosomonadales bacterium]